jgi:hypothetical protein
MIQDNSEDVHDHLLHEGYKSGFNGQERHPSAKYLESISMSKGA